MVTLLAHEPHLLGEGARWDAEHDRVLLVDILRGVIRHGPVAIALAGSSDRGRALDAVTVDGSVGCVAPVTGDPARLVAGVDDGVALVDLATGALEWLARPEVHHDGAVRMNDGAVDPAGALVVGSMHRDAAEGRGRLLRVHGDGRVDVLLDRCTIPNGLAWVDGGATLVHVESSTNTLTAYPYDPDGPLGPGRVVTRWDGEPVDPDGMCLDADGMLWVAVWEGSCVRVLDVDGRVLDEVATPGRRTTSCALLGDHGRLLVTSATVGMDTPGEVDGRTAVLAVDASGVAQPGFRLA